MRTLGSKGGCGCRRMEKENVLRETRAYEIYRYFFHKVNQTQLWFCKFHEAVS